MKIMFENGNLHAATDLTGAKIRMAIITEAIYKRDPD